MDGSQVDSLFSLWLPVAEQLRAAVPESTWNIWLADVHPHTVGDYRLVVAAREEAVMWVRSRFGRLIGRAAAAAGRDVVVDVVPCLGAPAQLVPEAAVA